MTLSKIKETQDIEIAGIIAALISYGRVEIIIKNINDIFTRMEHRLYDFVTRSDYTTKKKLLRGFKHRFNDDEDMAFFLHFIGNIINQYGSIERFFNINFKEKMSIKGAIANFSNKFREMFVEFFGEEKKSSLFLIPSPERGCACKRINMYLRWMVRKNDGIDLGVWQSIPLNALIIPLDVHIVNISRELKITQRKSADWQMAEEVTAFLREIDPEDPVKFDFSLCHYGKLTFRKEIV
ncbi:MAG: TIGR02757 family protein [Chitinispirillaceae bacterium]|nr:TIGR02757 family protein [Chitinispirillaceae bacterium]